MKVGVMVKAVITWASWAQVLGSIPCCPLMQFLAVKFIFKRGLLPVLKLVQFKCLSLIMILDALSNNVSMPLELSCQAHATAKRNATM